MSDWGNEETATTDFSDERLNKRMRVLLDRLGSKPSASLPEACKGWDETIAAYRFFNNEKVTGQKYYHRTVTQRASAWRGIKWFSVFKTRRKWISRDANSRALDRSVFRNGLVFSTMRPWRSRQSAFVWAC